jgi:hypothetical protein
MKQEHLFCAHVFHALYEEIDFAKQVLFCLDGSAAKQNTIPDFCFHFKTGTNEFRMEAKVVTKNRISLQPNQRIQWTQNGTKNMKPNCWIGADELFEKFFFWPHEEFEPKINKHRNSTAHLLIDPKPFQFRNLKDLIDEIINFATDNGFRKQLWHCTR